MHIKCQTWGCSLQLLFLWGDKLARLMLSLAGCPSWARECISEVYFIVAVCATRYLATYLGIVQWAAAPMPSSSSSSTSPPNYVFWATWTCIYVCMFICTYVMSLAADMLAYRNLIESLTKQSKRVINSIFGVEKLFCLGKSKTSPVIPATTECCPISSR